MNNQYEVVEHVHSVTGERYWQVRDWEQDGRIVSVNFRSLDRAERCRNALIADDRRDP